MRAEQIPPQLVQLKVDVRPEIGTGVKVPAARRGVSVRSIVESLLVEELNRELNRAEKVRDAR